MYVVATRGAAVPVEGIASYGVKQRTMPSWSRHGVSRSVSLVVLAAVAAAPALLPVACGSDPSEGAGETVDAAPGQSPDGGDGGFLPVEDGGDASEGSDGSADASADGGAKTDGGLDGGDGRDGGDGLDGGDGGDGSDGAAPNDDPFDPLSCDGVALTSAQALARLGAASHVKLADATLYRRTRACAGATPETCGAWTAPVPHTQSLLTYSGGVVTDYKTFAFPTHLVLFAQGAAPRLSVRHVTDYMHDATASTRGVQFGAGSANPLINTYPIIYVWDFAPAPNRYDDLQGLLGDDGFLTATESCARVVFVSGVTTEIAALYRY